ncbi:nucleotidyltransferase family protein [Paenibacillus sp. YYML68]|uniref:nucleotidyltransferase family protein n=1 Tax=Paenibacillus sp. YYML68 TaxID=2909250 RepID=UPI002491DC42|nr:nucleotidyltransferase family protein [Paenibacillus sp. YYML68]
MKLSNEHTLLLQFAREMAENSSNVKNEVTQEINWEYMIELARQKRVYPMFYHYIKENIPIEYRELYDKTYQDHVEKVKFLIQEMKELTQQTSNDKIIMIFLKGIVLSNILYGDSFTRHVGDVDTLINQSDIEYIDHMLRSNGYIQLASVDGKVEETPFPILKSWSHHEYFGYHKKMQNGRTVELEVQRFLHQTVKNEFIGCFLEATQVITIDNIDIMTLDQPHTFLAICENAYYNAETANLPSLAEYIDIYNYIKKYNPDWDEIKELAVKYNILTEMNYVFKAFSSIYPQFLDQEIIDKFNNKRDNTKKVFLQWKDTFINRLFLYDFNRYQIEIFKMRKAFAYSGENDSYKTPHQVKKLNEVQLMDINAYKELHIEKYNSTLHYLTAYDNENLYFYFSFNNQFFAEGKETHLLIDFIDRDVHSDLFYKHEICINCDKLDGYTMFTSNIKMVENWVCPVTSSKDARTQKFKSVLIERDNIKIMEVKIKLDDIGIEPDSGFSMLAYNVSIDEKVYSNVKHKIASHIHNFNTSANLPVLKIG